MHLASLCTGIALAAGLAFAGRVVTYTATSDVSQEDADRAAAAGVAQQISTNISSSRTTHKSESSQNGEWESSRSYSETNKLRSDLTLQGMTIHQGEKQGRRYTSTATLDIGQATARIRYKMQDIQRTANKKAELIRKSVADRDIPKAIEEYETLRPLQRPYAEQLENLSLFEQIDSTYFLNTNEAELAGLINGVLSKLQYTWKVPMPQKLIAGDAAATLCITDSAYAVPGIPLFATQNGKVLTQARTDADGCAEFQMHRLAMERGQHSVSIEPGISAEFVRDANMKSLNITYSAEPRICEYNLLCNEKAIICGALDELLGKWGLTKNPSGKSLRAVFSSQNQKTFQAGSTELISLDLTLSLSAQGFSYTDTKKGVGQNIDAAKITAISKMPVINVPLGVPQLCKE